MLYFNMFKLRSRLNKYKFRLIASILIFSFGHPALSMDENENVATGINLTKKYTINPRCNLFNKEEQFSVLGESNLVLKVNFSEPIYEVVKCINFDDPLDSTETPAHFKILMKNSTFFDIISNEKCVGNVKTDIMPNALNEVYIRKIEVNKEHQGAGIGTQALGLLVQFYLQKGYNIESFGAQIEKDNAASIKIFEKNGFLTDGSLAFGMFAYVLNVKNEIQELMYMMSF